VFDLELEKVKAEVQKLSAKRVLVHLPEGLMSKADEIVSALPCEVLLWAKPSYGSCDLPTWAPIDVDLIVAYGHSGEHEGVLFIEAMSDREFKLEFTPPGVVGILYTIQFREQAMKLKAELEAKGKKVLLGNPGRMVHYPGQITGCDITSALNIQSEVDSFLFVGEGKFHQGALELDKPVFDAAGNDVRISKKKRHALVLTLKSFGVLLSIKPGQRDEALAKKLKSELERMGKTVYTIVGDDFDSRISNYPVDAFVTTACPRLAGDTELFGKPILTSQEVLGTARLA